jgi:hypothetical protein
MATDRNIAKENCGDKKLPNRYEKWHGQRLTPITNLILAVFAPVIKEGLPEEFIANIVVKELTRVNGGSFGVVSAEAIPIASLQIDNDVEQMVLEYKASTNRDIDNVILIALVRVEAASGPDNYFDIIIGSNAGKGIESARKFAKDHQTEVLKEMMIEKNQN